MINISNRYRLNENELIGFLQSKCDKMESLSIIIPTYNRCPYPKDKYFKNPLVWALYSLLNQQFSGLKKIIVVNDASTDYTNENINFIKSINKTSIEIVHIKNQSRYRPHISRNIGLNFADTELVFFMDDDCILHRNSLAGMQSIRQSLREKYDVGSLHIPVFIRDSHFETFESEQKIGKIDFEKGYIFSNFRSFPQEYIDAPLIPHLWDTPYIMPIEIDFFHEVFLIETKLIKEAGGFVENIGLDYVYSEGLFLTIKLRKYDVHHFQIVDPNIFAIHFRYGNSYLGPETTANDYELLVGDRFVLLKEMIFESSIQPRNR